MRHSWTNWFQARSSKESTKLLSCAILMWDLCSSKSSRSKQVQAVHSFPDTAPWHPSALQAQSPGSGLVDAAIYHSCPFRERFVPVGHHLQTCFPHCCPMTWVTLCLRTQVVLRQKPKGFSSSEQHGVIGMTLALLSQVSFN